LREKPAESPAQSSDGVSDIELSEASKILLSIEERKRQLDEQIHRVKCRIALEFMPPRVHDVAETDEILIQIERSRYEFTMPHIMIYRNREGLYDTTSVSNDSDMKFNKYPSHANIVVDRTELNKMLAEKWNKQAEDWWDENKDKYKDLLLARNTYLTRMKGALASGDRGKYREEKAKYEESLDQLKEFRMAIGEQMGIDQSVQRHKAWSNVMAEMIEIEYDRLVELHGRNGFRREQNENEDRTFQQFQQYYDVVDIAILDRYHALKVLRPNARRREFPQDLQSVLLNGTKLSRRAFQKALRVGDYGIHQAWRVVKRIAALEQADAKAVARVIYEAGWYAEGRNQVFNYLRSIGAIDDDVFRAGIELIAYNGRPPELNDQAHANPLGDAQAPVINIPQHYADVRQTPPPQTPDMR
jgi:hypothetical protein